MEVSQTLQSLEEGFETTLEDGLLSDAQKIEFLPKFVTGEAYDAVERSARCSYEDIVANLEFRSLWSTSYSCGCLH